MKLSVRKYVSLALPFYLAMQLALSPLAYQNAAMACGPFFDEADFSLSIHPDPPFKLYVKGQIGIVQPTYADSYQIVAYRYLSGKPLTASEQAAYLEYWHELSQRGEDDDPQASQTWFKDRTKVAGPPGKNEPSTEYFDVHRSSGAPDGVSSYLNCPADAFKTASATLAKLVAKYGASSPICKEWLKGQDAVFCHCQSPGYDYSAKKSNAEPAFPDKLPDSALLELRQDRQYQMAAAFFYAQKLDDALNLFKAIAEDNTSPWHTIAQYMIARTLVRKGTLSRKDSYDTDSLAKAITVLKQLSSNPNFTTFKSSIDDLIDFAQIRLDPAGSCQILGKLLANPYAGEDLGRKIDDFGFVTGQVVGLPTDADDGSSEHKPKVDPTKVASILRSGELADWIWSLGNKDKAALACAAEGFKTHHNLAWAVAYASNLSGNEPAATDVAGALARTAKGDPGFITASYYRAMLLLGGKHFKEADITIAQALASPNLTPSAANDFTHLKLNRAATLEEFFALSFRPPAATIGGGESEGITSAYNDEEKKNTFAKNPLMLLPESAEVINSSFPLADMAAGTSSKNVAPAYVKQFAQATFTRAVLLGDWTTALKMTPLMKKSYPSVAKQISDFEAAKTPGDQAFAAVCLFLKCPGIRPTVTGGTGRGTAFDRIDDYQDNWWDKDTLTVSGDRGGGQEENPHKVALATPFLSSADKALAKSQLAKLQAMGEAPNYMGKIVIAYARAHPTDSRVPEALALTVKATHFGSTDESKTTAVSTHAFQILHKSYPGNQWTRKTPYHY